MKKPLYIVRETVSPVRGGEMQPRRFSWRLADLIGKYRPDVEMVVVTAFAQKQLLRNYTTKILNLDPFTRLPSHQVLDICRVFKRDEQEHCLYWAARPEAEPLHDQLDRLADGEYMLVDDDVSTGGTMQFVKKLIQQHRPKVVIKSVLSLLNAHLTFMGLDDRPVIDMVDDHDFKWSTPTSGLVIDDELGIRRELYTSPAVNLATRAKIGLNGEAFKAELLAII